MAIELAPLWDHRQPAASEQRFQDALKGAVGDDALILKTQIARTHGIRKDFDRARRVLAEVQPFVASAGPEAQVRYHLELGRTHASATHMPEQLTREAKDKARAEWNQALATARTAQLDGLAIDALHMMAFIDTAPADQLKWNQQVMDAVQATTQPDAKKWEAAARNNLGYALHQVGRHDDALVEFQKALKLREAQGNAFNTHVAHWMIAWTLRALGRTDEALAIQLRLEQERDTAKEPDEYVFEELQALYAAKGDAAQAAHYAERLAMTRNSGK